MDTNDTMAYLVFVICKRTGRVVGVGIHSAPAESTIDGRLWISPHGFYDSGCDFEEALANMRTSLRAHANFLADPGTPLHAAILAVANGVLSATVDYGDS